MPQIINQNGTVVDLISHGPIEGLVRGAGSIILDGTPINTANVIGSSGSASTETVQFKAKINSSSGTTSTFTVPLLSVSHILEKECNIDGTLKDPLLRYLWVDKAGQTFSNYTQVGQIMNGGTGLYGDTDHDLELPFAIGPIDGLQAFGSEKDKSNLKYTFTLDAVPGFRSFIRGAKTREYDSSNPFDFNYSLRDTSTKSYAEFLADHTNSSSFGTPFAKVFISEHTIGEQLHQVEIKGSAQHKKEYVSYALTTLRFDYLAEITKIVANPDGTTATITCTNKVGANLNTNKIGEENVNAYIFSSGRAINNVANFAGDFQFFNGTIDQPPSSLVAKTANNLSIAIGLNKPLYYDQAYGGDSGSVNIASSTGGRSFGLTNEQVSEIDKLKLTVVFPNGLFFKRNTGKNIEAIMELFGEIQVRNGPTDNFRTFNLFGRTKNNFEEVNPNIPWDDSVATALNLSGMALGSASWDGSSNRRSDSNNERFQKITYHGKAVGGTGTKEQKRNKLGLFFDNTTATFGHDLYFDLNPFKPFTDFIITIRRVTPHTHDVYNTNTDDDNKRTATGSSLNAVLQTAEVIFEERLSYPLSAYAAVEFSGREFQDFPERAYHCRGLKVKVPSNYTTREENFPTSVATYNRRVERAPDSEVSFPNYELSKSNVLRFSMFLKEDTEQAFESKNPNVPFNPPIRLTRQIISGGLFSRQHAHEEGVFEGPEGGYNAQIRYVKSVNPSELVARGEFNAPNRSRIHAFYIQFYRTYKGNLFEKDDVLELRITNRATGTTKTFTVADSTLFVSSPGGANWTHPTYGDQGIQKRYLVLDPPFATRPRLDSFAGANNAEKAAAVTDWFLQNSPIPTEGMYDFEIVFREEQNFFPPKYQPWDGSFRGDYNVSNSHPNYQKVYTNNPAWIYYDLLTNKEYGLGNYVDEQEVDKFELYQIGKYCDELVPAFNGQLEARFTCNAYITSSTEAYKLLKDLASVFRGMPIYQRGLVSAVQDRPKEPVYMFTQSNIINGSFDYEYTGTRARANQIVVTWNDPQQNYAQDVITVEDDENIVHTGKVNSKEIVAFGCTSKGQAYRAGLWHLKTSTLETEIIKFSTSINAAHLNIGDIIRVQDQESGAKVLFSGRIAADYGNFDPLGEWALSVDRPVIFTEEDETEKRKYDVHIQVPSVGVYLQQDRAVINGVEYKRGDSIQRDKEGTLIQEIIGTTNLKKFGEDKTFVSTDLNNLLDDNDNLVTVQIAKDFHIETFSINVGATRKPFRGPRGLITLGGKTGIPQFIKELDLTGSIWAITRSKGDPVGDSISRLYRIISLNHSMDYTQTNISAALYVEEKFDEVESSLTKYPDSLLNIAIESISLQSLGYGKDFPPQNIVSGSGTFYEDQIPIIPADLALPEITSLTAVPAGREKAVKISFSANFPHTTKMLRDGTSIHTTKDLTPFGVKIEHNMIGNSFKTIDITNTNIQFVEVDNVLTDGTYTFKATPFIVRENGDKIFGTTKEEQIGIEISAIVGTVIEYGIPAGGHLENALQLDKVSGKIIVGGSVLGNYIHPNTSTAFEGFGSTASNVGRKEADFASLDAGNTGVLVLSAAQHDAGAGFLALEEVSDTFPETDTGASQPEKYLKAIDGANNGLSEISNDGTAATVKGNIDTSTLTGINSKFLTDFSAGDLIKIVTNLAIGDQGAESEYNFVSEVLTDTKLILEKPLIRNYGVSVGLSKEVGARIAVPGHDWVKLGESSGTTLNDSPEWPVPYDGTSTTNFGAVSAISKASTGVVTFTNAEFTSAQVTAAKRVPIYFVGGQMTEILTRHYYAQPTGTTTATLHTHITGGSTGLDTSGFTTYSSGGYAKALPYPWNFDTNPDGRRVLDRITPNPLPRGTSIPGTNHNKGILKRLTSQFNFGNSVESSYDTETGHSEFGYNEVGGVMSIVPTAQGRANKGGSTYVDQNDGENITEFTQSIQKQTQSSYGLIQYVTKTSNLEYGLDGLVTVTLNKGSLQTVTITTAGAGNFSTRDTSGANFTANFIPKVVKDPFGVEIAGAAPNVSTHHYDSTLTSVADLPVFQGTFNASTGALTSVVIINGGTGILEGMTFEGIHPTNSLTGQIGISHNGIATTDTVITAATIDGFYGRIDPTNGIKITETLSDASGNTALGLNTEYLLKYDKGHTALFDNPYSFPTGLTQQLDQFTRETIGGVATKTFGNIRLTTVNTINTSKAYQATTKINRMKDAVLAKVEKDSTTSEFSVEYKTTMEEGHSPGGETSNPVVDVQSQNPDIIENRGTTTQEATFLQSTIDVPPSKGSRIVAANASIEGRLGFLGPDLTVSDITRANPCVVTTSTAHGLGDNASVTFRDMSPFEISGQTFFIERGDGSGNLDTKFRIHETLNRGVVQSISFSNSTISGTMKYAANLSSETCTIASGTSGTNGTGTGLKVDVTTNSSGVITTLVPNTGNAGVNFARGDSLTLPDTADDGTTVTASSSPVAAVITVNEIDYVLGGAKDTSSGFTAYTGSDGHVRESNSATFSLAATIDSPTQTATVPGSEVTTSIFVFSSYVGIFITYRTWQIAYGAGKTYSTFSAAVEGYNIVVGAVVTQDLSTDYVDTIVGVADGGDHVGFNTLSIATAESGTALSIAITPTTKTTYDVSAPVNTLEDNSTTVNLTMSTSTIKTTGTATLELQGKETSPGSIGLSNISNLIVDSDMVFTTDQAHGFGTGTKVSFTNVQFKGSSGGTATGDVIAGKGPNNEGANDFIKYVVTKVSERTFTIGTEADPSTALHGIRFYESTAFDATGGAYILVSGVVKPERASIVNNASLVEQQIS